MKKPIELDNKERPIIGLYFIALPMFIGSLYIILNIDTFLENPAARKAAWSYAVLPLSILLGAFFYALEKSVRQRKLVFLEDKFWFGKEEAKTLIHAKNIESIIALKGGEKVVIKLKKSTPNMLDSHVELNLASYTENPNDVIQSTFFELYGLEIYYK